MNKKQIKVVIDILKEMKGYGDNGKMDGIYLTDKFGAVSNNYEMIWINKEFGKNVFITRTTLEDTYKKMTTKDVVELEDLDAVEYDWEMPKFLELYNNLAKKIYDGADKIYCDPKFLGRVSNYFSNDVKIEFGEYISKFYNDTTEYFVSGKVEK